MAQNVSRPIRSPNARLVRLMIVLTGIILGQVVLYGPCLIGRKLLLPLDTLTKPGEYIPRTAEVTKIEEWDKTLSDRVRVFEPGRRFAARELHAGRLPLWSPYYFAGAPFMWPLLSPFAQLECLTDSPVILAWKELAIALVAGLGMYCFARRVLRVGFWPACFTAWCYPLSGFLVIWRGFALGQTVCLLPWILLAVDQTIKANKRFSVLGLSLATALTATAGQLDVAGQTLLISGLYALWCLWNEHRKNGFWLTARRPAARLILGWSLGLMLAAPQILPITEYARTGIRMRERSEGVEERPPEGVVALPSVFLPDFYGRTTRATLLISPSPLPGNVQESAVGAYAGVLVMLFLAPLAFGSRRHRSMNVCLSVLACFGVAWVLNAPGIVKVLRLPGLNMMSHNRLVFATGFAFVALAAVGLEVLANGTLRWKRSHALLALPLAGLSCLCIYRSVVLPEPVATRIGLNVSHGKATEWVKNREDVLRVQTWFFRHSLVAGVICAVGAALWLFFALSGGRGTWSLLLVAVSIMAELLWYAQKRQPLCDPSLYYPRVPALEQVAKAAPGRAMGWGSLPPNLGTMVGLRMVSGYDAVDPADLVELMRATADPNRTKNVPSYASTQNLVPQATFYVSGNVKLPAILDMLGVRYLICRGMAPPNVHPVFASFDYYVLENTNALPRVFVPRRVQALPDHDERLRKIVSPDFDPRQIAYVESSVESPDDCRGRADVSDELPGRISIRASMDTPGLVVLADLWTKGWRASLDGKPARILRTDHALRGVIVSAGEHSLEFRYEPASFVLGLGLAGMAVLALAGYSYARWRAPAPKPDKIPEKGARSNSRAGIPGNRPQTPSRE